MPWIGGLILIGILALLLIAGVYLGNSEKTPNRRPASSLDDFYRSSGLGNVLDANEKLNELSEGEHQRHAHGGQQQHHQHKHDEDE
ncbi:MAG TPA: hypothetical protein VKR83_03405 [Ktedonobacteraceae bacterium]|nr:hypothetical protein [Ktedonobacteraceae bacterium]